MAVAPRFLSNAALTIALTLSCAFVSGESLHAGNLESSNYVAKIKAHTPKELSDILMRLDLLLQDEDAFPSSEPLALVLHGDEVRAFLKGNYKENRDLVDLAARLDAFNAVDIQVCETWLKSASISKGELPAFVETVPYGPRAERELINQGYEYF